MTVAELGTIVFLTVEVYNFQRVSFISHSLPDVLLFNGINCPSQVQRSEVTAHIKINYSQEGRGADANARI